MDILERLRNRRTQIIREIEALEPMRKGSVVDQFVETARKDGSKSKRGPYPLYSYKDKGRTISRRVAQGEEADAYRQQIEVFRRFETLSAELVDISQRIADQVVSTVGDEKKSSRR